MALVKYNNNSISAVTALDSIASGSLNLIKTTTASGVSNVDLNHGSSGVVLDGTYDTYLFKLINIHVSNNAVDFSVNFSTDNQSTAAVKTTTHFMAYHNESGSSTSLEYRAGNDVANAAGDANLADNVGNHSDASLSGELFLFSPSNTTFVKHFLAKVNFMEQDSTPYTMNAYSAGYVNVTAAVNSVRFLTSAGTFDGTIKLYGLSKSWV